MEKDQRKLKQIHFRVTEDEYNMIKEKGEKYSSISAIILEAVKNFDERDGCNIIDVLDDWARDFGAFKVDLSRIGNNINQVAHYVNTMKTQGVYNENVLNIVEQELSAYNELLVNMVKAQERFAQRVCKF